MSKTAKEVKEVDNIFKLANNKLTLLGTKAHILNLELASLGIWIGITFNLMSPAACEVESWQVKPHMRIVHSIPKHREYMQTGHPTEPILAEAAAQFLDQTNMSAGIASSGPQILAQNIQAGFLAKGKWGELCGQLLVTIANNLAIGKCPNINTNNPLAAIPATCDADGPTLETTFKEAFVYFSHFALADDSEVLKANCLQTCLFCGLAMQCKDNQCSVDAVIPIHMGPITSPITTKTISAINIQIKNRIVSEHCSINQSLTIPDPKQPVISIMFEFGEKLPKDPLVQSHHTLPPKTQMKLFEASPGCDNNHYSFVAHGRTHKTYNAIPEEAKAYYNVILAAKKLQDEFPWANNPMSLALYQVAKPTLSAAEVWAEWGQQSKGPKNPSIDPFGRSCSSKQGKSEQPLVPGLSMLQQRISTWCQTKAGAQEEEPKWNGQEFGVSSGPSIPSTKGVGSGANMPNNQSWITCSHALHNLAELPKSGQSIILGNNNTLAGPSAEPKQQLKKSNWLEPVVKITISAKRYQSIIANNNNTLTGPLTEPKQQSKTSAALATVTDCQSSSQLEESEPEDEEPGQKGKGLQTHGQRCKSCGSMSKGCMRQK